MRTETGFDAWYVLLAYIICMTITMIYERSVSDNVVTAFMNDHPVVSLLVSFAGTTIVAASTFLERRY